MPHTYDTICYDLFNHCKYSSLIIELIFKKNNYQNNNLMVIRKNNY